MDRLGIFAVVASRMALQDAGIEVTDENRNRIGVVFGTGVGPMESMEKFARPLLEEGPEAANPAVFPNTVYNAAGGQVAMHVGTIGPATTVTAGHSAGASSICYGYDLVARNQADAVICLAADTLTDAVVQGYKELGLLSGDNEGFALAEAGIALVLERESLARARGARIYGEVLGYGIASDAKGVGRMDPKGRGVERAMKRALEEAKLGPDDVKAVWAGFSGHRIADGAERAAIQRLFGNGHATGSDSARIVAPKLLLGEPMGAGASLSAALALKAWQHDAANVAPVGPILINSGSMGGTHFSLVIAPYKP
jgi:3-oxoacyl-[acyl-carrier-protein] synthase II